VNDEGFNGSGSRFNSRFEAGSPILAKQLNDLAAGLQASLPMPFLGDGQIVSYTPGGSLITQTDNDLGKNVNSAYEYLNQFHCQVEKVNTVWRLKIVNGTLIFGNEHQSDQEAMTDVAAGSPLNIVTGTDENSMWMNSDGYVELPGPAADCGVYLLQVQSNDSKKFINYVYACKDADFEFPSTGRVVYGADIPPGLDLPTTDWTLQVIQIAKITYTIETTSYSVEQLVIGSQTLPAIVKPFPFQVDVINVNADVEGSPSWTLRVAKGVAISSPDPWGDSCINVEWVDVIDPGCSPYTGSYDDSLWTDNAGGIEDLNNSVDYDVYLFRVIETVDGVKEHNYKLWVGESTDYDDTVCPIVLPTAIAPAGDYVAQSIHIAYVSQPTASDVWVIEQITRGPITWPDYGTNCEPFKVHRIGPSETEGFSDYEICPGTVNNSVPEHIYDYTWSLEDGVESFFWIEATVGPGTPGEFPDPALLNIGNGSTVPADSDSVAHVTIATVHDDGTIDQFVTGSLWGTRLKLGTRTAQYLWSRI
jgi:hypothetical protein